MAARLTVDRYDMIDVHSWLASSAIYTLSDIHYLSILGKFQKLLLLIQRLTHLVCHIYKQIP